MPLKNKEFAEYLDKLREEKRKQREEEQEDDKK